MNDKLELEDILLHEIVPDIIRRADEPSKHNKSGEYKVKYDNQILTLNFNWGEENEKM